MKRGIKHLSPAGAGSIRPGIGVDLASDDDIATRFSVPGLR
jgi:hypothetical protein